MYASKLYNEFRNAKGLKLKKLKQKDNQRSPWALKIGFKRSQFLDSERITKNKRLNQAKRQRRNRDDRKKDSDRLNDKVHKLYDHSVDRKLNIVSKPYTLSHKPSLISSPHRAMISLAGLCEV